MMALPVGTIQPIEDLRIDFDASVNYMRAYISSSNDPDVQMLQVLRERKPAAIIEVRNETTIEGAQVEQIKAILRP
jgi:hypothetical protein